MSEWIIETKYLDSDGSSQLTTGRASGRMRSISEVYSIGTPCLDYESQDSRKNSEDGRCSSITSPAPNYGLTPQFSYEKSFENGKIEMVYGERDPSYNYVGLLDAIDSKLLEVNTLEEIDHNFTNALPKFEQLIFGFVKEFQWK